MTEKQPQDWHRETVEVRVRVSPQAAAIMKRDLEKAPFRETLAQRAGRILTAAILEQEKVRAEKATVAKVESVKADPEKRSVSELAKNHSMSQISAILKIPYAAVAKELGRGVDDIVRKRDAREKDARS